MAETTIPNTPQTTTHDPRASAPAETRDETRYLTPAVDIFERPEGLTLVVDLPGVTPEGLDVRLENDVLTLRGTPAPRSRFGTPTCTEFELGSYARQFQLGTEIDREKIAADFKNGVLTLSLPKAEKAAPRRIAVSVAS